MLAFLLTAVFYGIGFFPFQPTHSDGNGYYMYLPAFVYHDPGMHFLDQLAEDISGFSGTFFPMDTGQVVDKYTMGSRFCSFLFPGGGYSHETFSAGGGGRLQCALSAGKYRQRVLLLFFRLLLELSSGQEVCGRRKGLCRVLLITFGTGLFHYITMDGSYSHVYTYGMLALFLWLVERHEEEEHTKFKVLGGICFGLVTLDPGN